MASPQYLQQASAIISALLATEAGAEVVENFLKWRILESLVPVLTLPFRQARADLVNKLSGMETRLAMWSGSVFIHVFIWMNNYLSAEYNFCGYLVLINYQQLTF